MTAPRTALTDAEFYLEAAANLAASGPDGVEPAQHLFRAAMAMALVSLAKNVDRVVNEMETGGVDEP